MKNKKLIALALISIFVMTMFSGCIIISKEGMSYTLEWVEFSGGAANTFTVYNKTPDEVKISVAVSNSQTTEPTFPAGTQVAAGASLPTYDTSGQTGQYVWVKVVNNSSGKNVVGSHYITGDALWVRAFE